MSPGQQPDLSYPNDVVAVLPCSVDTESGIDGSVCLVNVEVLLEI